MKTPAPTIGAIETTYQGVRFRSRLEARWAVFFDRVGWSWEHEPEGYSDGHTAYLPDFWLPDQDCFWEVKADASALSDDALAQAIDKATMLAALTGKEVCVAFGFPQPDDVTGKLLVIFPDGSEEVLAWQELGDAFLEAAASVRAHRFWNPH